ncbi:hypothetical protein ACG873_21655 [Mesorhizobium sp. AaZ16]|uniref:hypothetical protein n=1 Tax=Mesorhizobium sp. AaZ16 TaxID=3402289 RepID=UPI00374E76B1
MTLRSSPAERQHLSTETDREIDEKGNEKEERKAASFLSFRITFGVLKKMQTIAVAVGAPVPPGQFEHNLMTCAESALDQGGQDEILVLYWFMPRTSEPYDFIGVVKRRRFQAPITQFGTPA